MITVRDILHAITDGQGKAIVRSIVFYDLLDRNSMPVCKFHNEHVDDTLALHLQLTLMGSHDSQKSLFVFRKRDSTGKEYADLHISEKDWHSTGIKSIEVKDGVLLLRGYVSQPPRGQYHEYVL